MDPLMVLGLSKGPQNQNDLARLKRRSKELHKYYMKRERAQEAKKVVWAFEQLKKEVAKIDPAKASRQKAAPAPAPAPAEASATAPAAGAGAAAGGQPQERGKKRPAGDEKDPNKRREAIREKLAARRQAGGGAAGGAGGEEAKRREAIRDKLAVKRFAAKVPVRPEAECHQAASELLAAAAAAVEASAEAAAEAAAAARRMCLLCPITIERIKTPVRGAKCKHLQCFDLESFVVNKCGACPVCGGELAQPAELFVDAYVTKVLADAGPTATEVSFDESGAWRVVTGAQDQSSEADELSPEAMEEDEADVDPPPDDAPTPPAARGGGQAGGAGGGASKRPPPQPPGEPSPEEIAAAKEAAKEAAALARRADEERKLKALLPFIPKERKKKSEQIAKVHHELVEDLGPAVDPHDENSYVLVELPRPMGIVFEANPPGTGGVFIFRFDDGGVAANHGRLREGDQLVGAAGKSVLGMDVDACIDIIVADPSPLTKLLVFRGKPRHLYGRAGTGGASPEWIADILARAADGRLKPSPPLERRGKQHRISMPLTEVAGGDGGGSSSSDAGAFSEEGEEDDEEGGIIQLPSSIADCITGSGLEADLSRCIESLRRLGDAAAVPRRVTSAVDALPRAAVRGLVEGNAEEWAELEGKSAWRRAAAKRIAGALTERAERLELEERQRQDNERLAALEAARRSREEAEAAGGSSILIIEPTDRILQFGRSNSAQMTLKNSTPQNVAYKIRTNAPKHMNVQPCAGTLRKGEKALVKIVSTEKRLNHKELKFVVVAVKVGDEKSVTKERWAAFDKSAIKEWTLGGRGPH